MRSVYFLSPFALLHTIGATELVQGGGGILDASIGGITNRLAWYILVLFSLGRILGKKRTFFRIGFGVAGGKVFNALLRFALGGSEVTCRDRASLERLKRLGVKAAHMSVKPDAALELGLKDIPSEYRHAWDATFPQTEPARPRIALAVRYVKNEQNNARIREAFGGLVDAWKDRAELVFVAFQEHRIKPIENDAQTAREIDPLGAARHVQNIHHPMELLAFLTRCDMVVGMRLHANILAHVAGVPSVAIAYHPKVRSFIEEWSSADERVLIDLNNLSTQTLNEAVENLLAKMPPARPALENSSLSYVH